MLSIYILGLCMLAKGDGGRTVVIPDISASVTVTTPRGATCVEPHVAYIEVDRNDVLSCPDCFTRGDKEELYLHGDAVTIAGIEGPYSEEGYDTFVPHMKDVCPGFRLSIPPTASTVKITNGVLKPLDVKSKVRESLIEVNKVAGAHIVITVTHGSVTRTMQLKATTSQVVIANRYMNHLKGNTTPPLSENHWLAFYTLAAIPVVCDLPFMSGPSVETTSACSNSGYP